MILIKDRHLCIQPTFHCLSYLGNMILIKDRHIIIVAKLNIIFFMGNMILIKDRHLPLIVTTFPTSIIGKYDTYKGSTL